MSINLELIKLARQALALEKKSFQPPMPPDPMAGGMPPGMPPGMPMDPSMMGGAPPGGMPPMDPAMMGGMPPGMPMDPSMMGGAPPMPPMPMDPSMMGGPVPGAGGLTADSIRQIIQEEIAKAMPVGGANGGATNGTGKPAKPDLALMSADIFQTKKMIEGLYNAMGLPYPDGIMDGQNRDPATGMAVGAQAAAKMSATNGDASPTPRRTVEPATQPAGPEGGGGQGEKSGAIGSGYPRLVDDGKRVHNKAAALAACMRKAKV